MLRSRPVGYDLFIRSDGDHGGTRRVDEIAPVLQRLGLRHTGGVQWVREVGSDWMEVYLSWVTPGPDGGDALDGDGVHVNELGCHPKPLTWSSLAVVYELAAALGWEIHDPQHGVALRDAIATPAAPGPRFTAGPDAERPPLRTVARDGWRDHGRALLALPDDRWVLAYGGRTIGSPIGVQLRAGPDAALRHEVAGAIGPIAATADGTLLLAGAPQAEHAAHGTTVYALEGEVATPRQV
jgi:hypothetical protein